jgi:polyisoprenoid-binding protein YceI
MKHFLSTLVCIIGLSAGCILPAHAAPETYTLDHSHSYVLWRISHFGFSSPAGKWFADGTLTLDKNKPQNSKVNVIINVADMDTGLPKLDEHLKSKDFFDTATFHEATFVSNKIEVTGKNTAKVYGVLTLHGVSKPLMLNVKMNKVGENPISHKMTAGFSAVTSLKRSDFGITTYLPGLGNQVDIHIEVEAFKD